ncbi:unnamed protein product [Brassica oleracea var. botrytis]
MALWFGGAVVGFGLFLVSSSSLSWRVLSVGGMKLIIDPRGLSLVGCGCPAVALE